MLSRSAAGTSIAHCRNKVLDNRHSLRTFVRLLLDAYEAIVTQGHTGLVAALTGLATVLASLNWLTRRSGGYAVVNECTRRWMQALTSTEV